MNKFLVSFALVGSLLGMTAFSTANAEEMNYDELVYEDKDKGQHYSLKKNKFLASVANKKIKNFEFKYLRLTNNTYFSKNTYLVTLAQESKSGKSFSEKMEVLSKKQSVAVSNIVAGKVANNGTVIAESATDNTVAPEPEVKEFKVIDIK